jgi:hypothetical protein
VFRRLHQGLELVGVTIFSPEDGSALSAASPNAAGRA